MKLVYIVVCVVLLRNGVSPLYPARTQSCGIDRATTSVVYEGVATLQEYPWMGTLFYQLPSDIMTAAVVLVSKQIALASAHEIDKLPKNDLRQKTTVVFGTYCRGPGIKVRDYSFHPEYRRTTFHALALIQLETDHLKLELVPICGPPTFLHNPIYFAMTPSNNCKKARLQIRKMKPLDLSKCKHFYRKSGLDNDMFWPTAATCAHAMRGGNCVWRSGTALAVKQHGRWHLLGFGMHGPGCQAPSRFVDFGAQAGWVRRSIARTGAPAITRLADDHIVLRRPMSNVQRFGPCDEEETAYEMYMDQIIIKSTVPASRTYYNLTLVHGVEYSCVVFRATPVDSFESEGDETPLIHLRRWCAGPPRPCYSYQFLEIEFFVEIHYTYDTAFVVRAYGKIARYIEPVKGMVYSNIDIERPPVPLEITKKGKLANNQWFLLENVTQINIDPEKDPDYIRLLKQRQRG